MGSDPSLLFFLGACCAVVAALAYRCARGTQPRCPVSTSLRHLAYVHDVRVTAVVTYDDGRERVYVVGPYGEVSDDAARLAELDIALAKIREERW